MPVREHLEVEPRIVDSLYCATTPDLGDGFEARRNGSILVVYGENLFKFAPLLGGVLGDRVRRRLNSICAGAGGELLDSHY